MELLGGAGETLRVNAAQASDERNCRINWVGLRSAQLNKEHQQLKSAPLTVIHFWLLTHPSAHVHPLHVHPLSVPVVRLCRRRLRPARGHARGGRHVALHPPSAQRPALHRVHGADHHVHPHLPQTTRHRPPPLLRLRASPPAAPEKPPQRPAPAPPRRPALAALPPPRPPDRRAPPPGAPALPLRRGVPPAPPDGRARPGAVPHGRALGDGGLTGRTHGHGPQPCENSGCMG